MSSHREVSPFFRLDLQSIQGRFTIFFLFTSLVYIILLFITDNYWRDLNRQKDLVIEQTHPIAYESILLLNLIKQSQTNLSQYLYLNDDSLERANKELWLIDIDDQKKLLLNRVNQLDDKNVKNQFIILNKELGELQRQQRELERTMSSTPLVDRIKYQVKNDVLFVYEEVEKSIQELIDLVKRREELILNKIQDRQQFFSRIIIISVSLGFVLCYILGVRMLLGIFKWIRAIHAKIQELSLGNLPESFQVRRNEFEHITADANRLVNNLQAVRNYALEVGRGNFSQETTMFSAQSDLGKSLTEMSYSLQKVYDQEKKRNWITEGLAEFAELLRANSHDIDLLCRKTISRLVEHLNILQGGIFILNQKDSGRPFLELKGAYAYGKEKFIQQNVETNEGLIGRVYNEKEKVYLKELPPDYMDITSGLGSTEPKTLILLPLLTEEGEVRGVIELASFDEFQDFQIEFLEKLCSSIASTISMVKTSHRNQAILEESQKIAQSLRQKEEESRKNAVALAEAQEKLDQRLALAQRENHQLSRILDQVLVALIVSDEHGKILLFNREAEHIFGFEQAETIGKNVKILMPQEYGIAHDQHMQSYLETGQKHILDTGRNTVGRHKEGKEFPIHLTVSELRIEDQYFFMAVVRKL